MEEIKDLLEENGAGHVFKAIKEVFYKYIERILDMAARKRLPGRGRQDMAARMWSLGSGRQDVAARI